MNAITSAKPVMEAHTFCHRCATRYVRVNEATAWPRKCPNCANLQFFNPTPIAVMLQRVRDGDRIGIATPLRGINPMRGRPAITGGYHDGWDQSSEEAGAREIGEEIGFEPMGDLSVGTEVIDTDDDVELLMTQSTGPFIATRRQNLVFSLSPVILPLSHFDDWEPNEETMAMHYSWGPEVLAFPSHTRALAKYFQRHHGIVPPVQYMKQPKTGHPVMVDGTLRPVFEVPYAQPLLDDGTWLVSLEDGGVPVAVSLERKFWQAR